MIRSWGIGAEHSSWGSFSWLVLNFERRKNAIKRVTFGALCDPTQNGYKQRIIILSRKYKNLQVWLMVYSWYTFFRYKWRGMIFCFYFHKSLKKRTQHGMKLKLFKVILPNGGYGTGAVSSYLRWFDLLFLCLRFLGLSTIVITSSVTSPRLSTSSSTSTGVRVIKCR